MEHLSETLRRAVADSGLSQYRIAQEAGVSEATLSRFVRGHRHLTLRTADAIARVLGLELRPARKGGRR